jgi:hypothetical protein
MEEKRGLTGRWRLRRQRRDRMVDGVQSSRSAAAAGGESNRRTALLVLANHSQTVVTRQINYC